MPTRSMGRAAIAAGAVIAVTLRTPFGLGVAATLGIVGSLVLYVSAHPLMQVQVQMPARVPVPIPAKVELSRPNLVAAPASDRAA